MSGGEADAIKISIKDLEKPLDSSVYKLSETVSSNTFNPIGNTYYWSNAIYYYQITCPKRGCKTLNWAQIDTIVACKKCGSKLKAVSEQADFEIPVK